MSTRTLPVLIVDDEPGNIELFKMQFEGAFAVRTAAGGDEALAIMAREAIGVLLTDERMPGMTGVDLLARAVLRWPDTVRVIVSAYSDSPRLLQAINRGHAHEYLVKPWDKAELAACMDRGLAIAERRRALVAQADMAELYARDTSEHYDTAHVVGEHGGLQDVVSLARRAAQADATLLITGETGTGKELIARLVHDASPRASHPFVRVNCAALAEGVLESELFGHEQGAFTGAHRLRRGRFELAHDGTIFLDEIGELSAKMQAMLLRVLQEKEIERVGGASPISVDVRVLAATHRDLRRLVREGQFREDLYYRLAVVPLHVPALRDRIEDVRPLVQYFLGKYGRRIGKIATLDTEVYEYLEAYPWPGNVREVENMVQRALVLAKGPELTVEDFAFDIEDPPVARTSMRPSSSASLRGDLKDEERRRIMDALDHCQGNQSNAAKHLGMPRRTLVERLRAYGVSRKRKE
jgi:DNA-binding NtrC family response regulator